jgi:hypothetical protein
VWRHVLHMDPSTGCRLAFAHAVAAAAVRCFYSTVRLLCSAVLDMRCYWRHWGLARNTNTKPTREVAGGARYEVTRETRRAYWLWLYTHEGRRGGGHRRL